MYRYTKSGMIARESDGACIPLDPNNKDYATLVLAVALRNAVIQPYEPPEPQPKRQSIDEKLDLLVAALVRAKLLTEEDLK